MRLLQKIDDSGGLNHQRLRRSATSAASSAASTASEPEPEPERESTTATTATSATTGSTRSAIENQQQQAFPQQAICEVVPPESTRWQSSYYGKDYQKRRKMIRMIAFWLQERTANPSPTFLKELPIMAKHLEVSLYRSAKSYDEYKDCHDESRLQKVKRTIRKSDE
jgi:hypothetical protein